MNRITKISFIITIFWLLAGTTYYGDQGWIRENGTKRKCPYDVRFDLPDENAGRQLVVETDQYQGDVQSITYSIEYMTREDDITYYILQNQDQTFKLIVDAQANLLRLLSNETSSYTFRDTIQWHLNGR